MFLGEHKMNKVKKFNRKPEEYPKLTGYAWHSYGICQDPMQDMFHTAWLSWRSRYFIDVKRQIGSQDMLVS